MVAATTGTEFLLWLLGGVALLLWGMRMVRTGVQRAFGDRLRTIGGRVIGNRFQAWGVGLAVTVLLQSSTATALLMSSLANRLAVPTAMALAVMLGADVGTTLVAQVFVLDISAGIPVLLFLGIVGFLALESRIHRNIARAVVGLGFLMLALNIITGQSAFIGESDIAALVIVALSQEPLLAVLAAAVCAWTMHSSLAAVLLIATLAAGGSMPVEAMVALVLGANLGGAVAPLIASLGGPVSARRVVVGNFTFKLTACVLALSALSPASAGIAALQIGPAQAVVLTHLAFNLGIALLFLPWVRSAAALLERTVKEPQSDEGVALPVVSHLDETDLESPSRALNNAVRETLTLGGYVESMVTGAGTALRTNDRLLMDEAGAADDRVDAAYESVKAYVTRLRTVPLDPAESRRASDVLSFVTNLEHAGDIVESTLAGTVRKKAKRGLQFSQEGQEELDALIARVQANLRLAMNVFQSGDVDLARALLCEKEAFSQLEREAVERHYGRLEEGRSASIETSALHLDVLRDLRRINSHLSSAAYPILAEAGELRRTRLKNSALRKMRPSETVAGAEPTFS
ncbi:MAG: Na/Pi cotransporter family protein [Alphaproteobacteria bacterium]|nr:Na/Pi cotransporter family protein [Alphaproteobacteria bacterium]